MINWYLFAAVTYIVTVVLIYIVKFCGLFGDGSVDDFAIWGQFGDYFGGSLNPILSFISVMLLINSLKLQNKSLRLQNQANSDLRIQLDENRKAEKIRVFDTLFFNLIDAQTKLFENFEINFSSKEFQKKEGINAFTYIEDRVIFLRETCSGNEEITEFLTAIDSKDQIYSILRGFSTAVKLITENLTEKEGFSFKDRRDHLTTLINFTNFSQIKLILMAAQFLDYYGAEYLKSSEDLKLVLSEMDIELELY